MPNPVITVTPDRGLRYHACAVCGAEIPSGCSVAGAQKLGKLVGVRAWAEGTCDDGKQGLLVVHECGDAPDMHGATAQHHATLRGEWPASSGVS